MTKRNSKAREPLLESVRTGNVLWVDNLESDFRAWQNTRERSKSKEDETGQAVCKEIVLLWYLLHQKGNAQ